MDSAEENNHPTDAPAVESDVVIHQPNESLVLDDLEKATAIFAEAIYRLVK